MSSISIIIATFNRAQALRETLEAMTQLAVADLDAHWIIVDNNSSDDTPRVIQEYIGRLPITMLFEPQPGKNFALNKAIAEVELGELVVFTDDDITPRKDWLSAIDDACARWPEHSVFGGKIDIKWPDGAAPWWVESVGWVQGFGFALHDEGEAESPYLDLSFPFGGNFWVRRSVFESGFCYNTQIGPRPKNRIMGSETTFLQHLKFAGLDAVYVPSAVVVHRVTSSETTLPAIQKRAFRFGRGQYYICGPPHMNLVGGGGGLVQILLIAVNALRIASTFLRMENPKMVGRRLYGIIQIAWAIETIKNYRCLGTGRAGS